MTEKRRLSWERRTGKKLKKGPKKTLKKSGFAGRSQTLCGKKIGKTTFS
jgi:hypothetical protein